MFKRSKKRIAPPDPGLTAYEAIMLEDEPRSTYQRLHHYETIEGNRNEAEGYEGPVDLCGDDSDSNDSSIRSEKLYTAMHGYQAEEHAAVIGQAASGADADEEHQLATQAEHDCCGKSADGECDCKQSARMKGNNGKCDMLGIQHSLLIGRPTVHNPIEIALTDAEPIDNRQTSIVDGFELFRDTMHEWTTENPRPGYQAPIANMLGVGNRTESTAEEESVHSRTPEPYGLRRHEILSSADAIANVNKLLPVKRGGLFGRRASTGVKAVVPSVLGRNATVQATTADQPQSRNNKTTRNTLFTTDVESDDEVAENGSLNSNNQDGNSDEGLSLIHI